MLIIGKNTPGGHQPGDVEVQEQATRGWAWWCTRCDVEQDGLKETTATRRAEEHFDSPPTGITEGTDRRG